MMLLCDGCPAKSLAEATAKTLALLHSRVVDLESRHRLECQQWHEDWNDLFGRLENIEKALETN